VERVHYPGLPAHPQHELAGRLLGGRRYGALVSFELREGNQAQAFRVLEALRIVLPATTLGDIYSTMMYPAHSSHAALTDAELAQVGITRGLLRVSAGIEDVEDLQADLDQALRAAE
jgi:cystathionine beta-lyase/cystathionine gamma-synthase